MKYRDVAGKVAEELRLPEELVVNTYRAYWKFIRASVESLPLKDTLTQEAFEKLRNSINIPSLGKLSCTYSRYLGVKNRYELINKIRRQ